MFIEEIVQAIHRAAQDQVKNLVLDMEYFAFVPSEICMLEHLERLTIHGKSVERIPRGIVNLKKLKYLKIDSYSLREPPPEIAKQGVDAVVAFFNELSREANRKDSTDARGPRELEARPRGIHRPTGREKIVNSGALRADRLHATAQPSLKSSACSNTVLVADSCLLGGYPYFGVVVSESGGVSPVVPAGRPPGCRGRCPRVSQASARR